MISWHAWFEDGITYSSTDYEWTALPRVGMLGIVEYEEKEWKPGFPYRNIVVVGDWYWMEEGRWRKVATHPEWGMWADEPVGKNAIKAGSLPDAEWDRIRQDMLDAFTRP